MFKDEHEEHEHALDVDALQYSFDVLTACSYYTFLLNGCLIL